MASRMAARSTTAGTPVKSCMRTRAGEKAISLVRLARRVPAGEGLDVVGGNGDAVLVAEQVLEEVLRGGTVGACNVP